MRVYKPRFLCQLPKTVVAVQWQPGQRSAGIVIKKHSSPGKTTLLLLPAHAVLVIQLGSFTVFAGDWIVTESTRYRQVVSNECFEQRCIVEGQYSLFALQETRDESPCRETCKQWEVPAIASKRGIPKLTSRVGKRGRRYFLPIGLSHDGVVAGTYQAAGL